MSELGQGLSSRVPAVFRLSAPAFFLGALCFLAALSPSLIPRSGVLQGVLAGASFAVGYLTYALIELCWRGLGLRGIGWRPLGSVFLTLGAAAILYGLWGATQWQADVHRAMNMPPVESARPLTIAATAMVLAWVLIMLGRLFRYAVEGTAHRLTPWLPERLALVLGVLAVVFVFNFIANDVIIRGVFTVFDTTYARLNEQLPTDQQRPVDPLKVGSAASLIGWEGIGAEGRNMIADPLDAAEISRITREPAIEPLRIYVGLGSATTPEARAALALQEAIRQGAFERGTLVINSPTGTGWVDPAGQIPLEVMTRGNVATISVQYSYLPSWLSLLALPEYGRETARAVFAAFHGHWRSLPKETRPRMYLFGLSLGSLNSQATIDFFDMVEAPVDGAYWVGPPFASRAWRELTDGRNEGTPEWLPSYRDGASVRFMGADGAGAKGAQWGRLRVLYLQYASDPIIFFSPSTFWRRPDWMVAPRGPDVSRTFRWIPLVTGLQLGFDLMAATTTPIGHGHVYSLGDYLAGWEVILAPQAISAEARERLIAFGQERGLHPQP